MSVYITSTGRFLPGNPVSNDAMEDHLGLIGGEKSRFKNLILRSNRIKNRYYARTNTGQQTHLNEELAANAVQDAIKRHPEFQLDQLECLCSGSTIPDLIAPGFASMIHGRLGGRPMDLMSSNGICAAGMMALKGAYHAVAVGDHSNAIAVSSELASSIMQGSRFQKESDYDPDKTSKDNSFNFFNADFLRWMLSDGAGAFLLENKPRKGGISLKIDWIDLKSFANEFPVCMYLGTRNPGQDMTFHDTWLSYPTTADADRDGLFVLRQDTKLLSTGIVEIIRQHVTLLQKNGRLDFDKIDHFMPHLSSYYFADVIAQCLVDLGINFPKSRWYTNLHEVGNVGSASMYLMLDQGLRERRFKVGEKILLAVPESGRFIMSFAHLTVVEA